MKYVIWGTGKLSNKLLEDYSNTYFYLNPIVAFVDNNEMKIGLKFWNIDIVSPKELENIEFDCLVIACNAVDEIEKQIKKDMKRIINYSTVEDLYQNIWNFYYEDLNILHKKVVVIGGKEFEEKNLLSAYMFSDKQYLAIENIMEIENFVFDYIIMILSVEYRELSSLHKMYEAEEQLIQLLIKQGVEKRKILNMSVMSIYNSKDKKVTYGSLNPDKTFLVIRPHPLSGLGQIIVQVLDNAKYAKIKGYIPIVDMKTYKNTYIDTDEVGKINGWDKFFEQLSEYSIDEVKKSMNVIISKYFRRVESNIILPQENIIHCNKKVKKEIDDFIQKYFTRYKKVLGIVLRGSDIINLKPYNHPLQPDREILLMKVLEIYDKGQYDAIFVASEEKNAIEYARNFLKNKKEGIKIFFYNKERIEGNIKQYLVSSVMYKGKDLYRVGTDYLIEIFGLINCEGIVAGDGGTIRAAIALRQRAYEDEYIFNLGRYGINEKIIR